MHKTILFFTTLFFSGSIFAAQVNKTNQETQTEFNDIYGQFLNYIQRLKLKNDTYKMKIETATTTKELQEFIQFMNIESYRMQNYLISLVRDNILLDSTHSDIDFILNRSQYTLLKVQEQEHILDQLEVLMLNFSELIKSLDQRISILKNIEIERELRTYIDQRTQNVSPERKIEMERILQEVLSTNRQRTEEIMRQNNS